jgi:hypothetical protein
MKAITFDEIAAAMRMVVEDLISRDQLRIKAVEMEARGEIETLYEIEKLLTTIADSIIRNYGVLVFGLLSTTFEELRESERQSARAKKTRDIEAFRETVAQWLNLQAEGIPEHKRVTEMARRLRTPRSTLDKRVDKIGLRTKKPRK